VHAAICDCCRADTPVGQSEFSVMRDTVSCTQASESATSCRWWS